MATIEGHVRSFVDYVNGVAAPAGQAMFLKQYGVTGATLPAAGAPISDGLSRVSNVHVGGGTISATWFLCNSFTFDSTYVGGTITISGATSPANNAAFVITSLTSANTVAIAPGPNNPGGAAVYETFGTSVLATISKGALLSDRTGPAPTLNSIIANARAAGQIPDARANVLVMVFPSFDFVPDSITDNSYGPPFRDANADGSSGGAHASEAAGVGAAYGFVFERILEPDSHSYAATVHEMIESILDPYYSSWVTGGWGLAPEACDSCGSGVSTINGVRVCGKDNRRYGGTCTRTGYISWPF